MRKKRVRVYTPGEDRNRPERGRERERGDAGSRAVRQGSGKREGTQMGGGSCRGPCARERVGVNYHYPPKTRLPFCFPPVSSFLFLSPVTRTPPTHHQRASISPLAFATPLLAHSPFSPPLPLSYPIVSSTSSSSVSSSTTVHLKYEFDITFHPAPLSRSTTPANRTSSSVSSSPFPPSVRPLPSRVAVPTITGPRTI